jgi:DNA-binding ferritin-like protein (Dps family)
MNKIINTIIGDLGEKKAYRENEKRAKALPAEYAAAYKTIKNYIFHTSGILTMEPLVALVEMLEEAAASGKHVTDVTGPDVATFADELVRGESSYFDQQRQKLNKNFSKDSNEKKA